MVGQEEIIKIRRWEQLILNDNRLTILLVLRERTIASQSQIQRILRDKGKKKISWTAIHSHFDLLTKSGLISRTEYEPLTEFNSKGVRREKALNVGFKLTAEGKDFLNTLIKKESD